MDKKDDFARLSGHRYVSLTTFRKTGKAVATPVWCAGNADRIYVWTNASSGKVKRLRNNRSVTLAPCTYNGRVLGPETSAQAEIMKGLPNEEAIADESLLAKYGWQWRLGRFFSRTFGRHSVFLKIT